jgi:hypothetical protein
MVDRRGGEEIFPSISVVALRKRGRRVGVEIG